ncbi:hypothetical protein [Plantactinospora sonchi]|uniref:Uncharacterized protein n=1 Tax=Plantactinospora sonchi TaxID=1544735 RepID=A0ABU7RWB0_9ACTN
MYGVENDLEEWERRQLTRFAEARNALAQWQARLNDKIEEIEAREAAKPVPGRDDVPEGAPPAYHRVQEKIDRGELDWSVVLTGETEDDDARKVHLWLEPRLRQVREVFALAADGLPVDEAIARAEPDLTRRDGQR